MLKKSIVLGLAGLGMLVASAAATVPANAAPFHHHMRWHPHHRHQICHTVWVHHHPRTICHWGW